MQMIADLHTHTLCATHAYNTFNEMAVAAKEIGYCALAVTDHAPAMPDAPHSWHFSNWSAMPHVINDVVMLYGAEANVMDTKGGLDMPESQLKDMDFPQELIVNATRENLVRELKLHKKPCAEKVGGILL